LFDHLKINREHKEPRLEALRYIDNAKETLKKANKENGVFKDIKYVRSASGTAFLAVLVALDSYLEKKEGLHFKKPSSIEEYQLRIAKHNKKLNALLNDAYSSLHILGYYHGTRSVKTVNLGFEAAEKIIEYI
jgi:Domain of unknown function (DUF5618)